MADEVMDAITVSEQLQKHKKHIKPIVLLLTTILTLVTICGITGVNKQSVIRCQPVSCLNTSHGDDCSVFMCPKWGTIDCFETIVDLTEDDMKAFVTNACESYEKKKRCLINVDSVGIFFSVDECGVLCKTLTV